MFGEDNDRIMAQRVAQRQQYGEELRKQMYDKLNKPQTPEGIYSTYELMTNPNVQGNAKNNRNVFGFHDKNIVFPQNLANRVPHRLPQQVQNQRQYNPVNFQNHDRGYQQTSIAPININFGANRTEIQPVLPRVPHANVLDPSSFAQRLFSVDQVVNNIHASLADVSGAENNLLNGHIPLLNQQIQQLRSDIERVSSSDINQALRTLSEFTKSNRNLIDQNTQLISTEIQSVKDRVSDIFSATNQFTSKFNEFSESAKQHYITTNSEISRFNQSLDGTNQRLASYTARVQRVAEETHQCTRSHELCDKTATSSFNGLQLSINELVQSISKQLADEIRSVSETRISTNQTLHSQIEEVNNRSSVSIQNLRNFVGDLSSSFSKMITDSRSNIAAAFEQTQNETYSFINDIGTRLDEIISQSEENFVSIQSEIGETVNEIKKNSVGVFNMLEKALMDESSARKRNSNEILTKYKNFQNSIEQELVLQKQHIVEIITNHETEASKHLHYTSDSILEITNPLIANKNRLYEIEQRMSTLEEMMQHLNGMFVGTLSTLTKNYNDLKAQVYECHGEIESNLSDLSKRIIIVEDPDTTPDFALREEVQDYSRRFDENIEGQMSGVENQLQLILSNLAGLTIGYQSRPLDATDKVESDPKPSLLSSFTDDKPSHHESFPEISMNQLQATNDYDIKINEQIPSSPREISPKSVDSSITSKQSENSSTGPVVNADDNSNNVPKFESILDRSDYMFNPEEFVINLHDFKAHDADSERQNNLNTTKSSDVLDQMVKKADQGLDETDCIPDQKRESDGNVIRDKMDIDNMKSIEPDQDNIHSTSRNSVSKYVNDNSEISKHDNEVVGDNLPTNYSDKYDDNNILESISKYDNNLEGLNKEIVGSDKIDNIISKYEVNNRKQEYSNDENNNNNFDKYNENEDRKDNDVLNIYNQDKLKEDAQKSELNKQENESDEDGKYELNKESEDHSNNYRNNEHFDKSNENKDELKINNNIDKDDSYDDSYYYDSN